MNQPIKERDDKVQLEQMMKPVIADLIAKRGTPGQIGLKYGLSLQVMKRKLAQLDSMHLVISKKPRAAKSLRKLREEEDKKRSRKVMERYFVGDSIAKISEAEQEHETKVRQRIASALPETWLGV